MDNYNYKVDVKRCIELGKSIAITLPQSIVEELELKDKDNRSVFVTSKASNGVAVIYLKTLNSVVPEIESLTKQVEVEQ